MTVLSGSSLLAGFPAARLMSVVMVSGGRDGGEWCLLDLVEVEDVADPCQNPFSVGNLFPFGIPVAVGNLFCVVVFLCHNHLVLVVSILIVQSYKLFKQCYCYFKTFA